jgi:hypothetical protein
MNQKKPRQGKEARSVAVQVKIAQPHGGALYAGGVPGHDGTRAGRRRSHVKEMLLSGAAQAVPVLLAHLEGKNSTLAQNAADKLLKYGIGAHRDENVSREEVKEKIQATIEIVRRLAPLDLADHILREMREVWQ